MPHHPCRDCTTKTKGYTCRQYCNRPDEYMAHIGRAGVGSVPDQYTIAGRMLSRDTRPVLTVRCGPIFTMDPPGKKLTGINPRKVKRNIPCKIEGCTNFVTELSETGLCHNCLIRVNLRKRRGVPEADWYLPSKHEKFMQKKQEAARRPRKRRVAAV